MPEPFQPGFGTDSLIDPYGGAPPAWGASPAGFAPPQQMAPPPPEPISDPEPPSKKFQDEAKEYVGKFCKASKAYVDAKKPTFEKYLRLYLGEMSVFDWQKGGITDETLNESTISRYLITDQDGKKKLGLTDYVHPISPLVHAYAHNSYLQIFSGPEYLTVFSEDEQFPPGEDSIPTEYKIQQLLLRKLAQGKIFATTFKSLVRLPLYGTVAGKVYWHSHKVPRWKWDLATYQKIRMEETVFEAPIIQPIPLDRWLPDPQALSSDINLWRGVGHRVARTKEDLRAMFAQGTYNLNEEEFERRWKDGAGVDSSKADDELTHDDDADQEGDDTAWIDVWEWHGRIPSTSQKEIIECCCTILTDKGADTPEEGCLVRLTTEPLLASGLRPFVCAHWTEGDHAFAQGMIAENEDTVYTLSQLIGQLEDVARHTSIPAKMARTNSPAYNFLIERGVIQPGDVCPFDDPNEVKDLPAMNVPTADLVRLVQMFKSELEQVSGQTSTYQGVSTGDQTATGMSILQKQSEAPNSTKTDLFARNYLEPALNISLGMLQQFTLTDQTIMVRGAGGNVQPLTITAEELQRGKYTVKVTLTDQSHTRIATAQSAERMLQALPNLKPMLQQDGWAMDSGEATQMWLDGLDTHRSERILRKMSTPEQMLFQENMMLKQQLASMPQPKAPGQPEGNGNGGQPNMHPGDGGPLVEQGGPMGAEPTDENAMAQQLQLEMQMMAPGQTPPGQGGGMM